MGMYRIEWDCCGSVTETDAWTPEECPFCKEYIPVSVEAAVLAEREWVDLTDDEIWEAVKNWNLKERVEGNYSLTRAVIAAFKEKNT